MKGIAFIVAIALFAAKRAIAHSTGVQFSHLILALRLRSLIGNCEVMNFSEREWASERKLISITALKLKTYH